MPAQAPSPLRDGRRTLRRPAVAIAAAVALLTVFGGAGGPDAADGFAAAVAVAVVAVGAAVPLLPVPARRDGVRAMAVAGVVLAGFGRLVTAGGSVHSDTAPAARARAPRDTRRLRRLLAAVLMPAGPAIIALLHLGRGGSDAAVRIAANPVDEWLGAALGWAALFTLVPGVYAALHVTRRRAPVLTAWTGGILIPAYLGMTALIAVDAATWAGVRLGLDTGLATQLGAETFGHPGVIVPVVVFVVGHIVGTAMLGILAVRAGLMPMWLGTLFALSPLAHLVSTVNGLPWLDFLGWAIIAAGMAVFAWHALHMPDDEWDVPPDPVRGPGAAAGC